MALAGLLLLLVAIAACALEAHDTVSKSLFLKPGVTQLCLNHRRFSAAFP